MTDSEQIVYISCVEEVRYSFVSHLSQALRLKGIHDVFVDCDDLLSKESQSMVEGARVSVMILPGNRTVCLDKLVKVLECQKNIDQVVFPVLYGVRSLESEWLSALDSKGFSSVHQSRKECSDSQLVKEIVSDVYEKLFYMERIGIYSKLLEIEKMVCEQPFGIRCVGIWGMPGIGKTTLAKAVFDQMSGAFDAYCFIEDYTKAVKEKGLYRLLEEQFLKEKAGAGGSITKSSLLRHKLNNKRVLVVLDDVRNPLAVESFLGGFDWFGPKSLIIITSRDKKVFRLCRVNQIYEVQGLNEKEALRLFSLCASINHMAEQNLHEVSVKVIKYTEGHPLALNIYGSELKGKRTLSEMETAFLKLKRRPPFKIVDAFKSSYDTLSDSEKNIFLDIACFFQGENVNHVMQLLEGCGFFPHVGIDVLVEKSLVAISDNCVRMHNLIQDAGREIIMGINGETVHIERRSRLWEPGSVKYLLEDSGEKENGEPKTTFKRSQGTKEIEGMFLDTSNLSFDAKPAAFENMLNLRLLKIYCSIPKNHPVINFPKGSLHSLPNELRLLHWENYSLQSLPQSFDPSHLVEINMPYSQLQKLWDGTENLEMLRTIRLCHSQQLVDIGDLLKAQNLEVIDLQGCTRLQSFPATGKLLHLRVVNLSGCTEVKSFPEIPPNIETLHLQGTGIKKLSIIKPNGGELVSLSELKGLSDALKLDRLTSLEKSSLSSQVLGKLICLNLSGCSELKTIKGFPRNLKQLYIAGTAVRKVPQLPQSLQLLSAHGCVSLKSIHFDFEKLPVHYTFSNCFDLSPEMVNVFLVKALSNAEHIPRERQQELKESLAFSFCAPSHAKNNSTLDLKPGSSVMTRLIPSWRNTLVGFAMLVEVAFPEDYCDATGFGIRCVCKWKNKEGHSHRIERNLHCWALGKAVQKAHMFVFCDVNMRPSTDEGYDPNIWADLVVFEFFPVSKQTKPLDDCCTVTRCGVRVITAANCNTSLENISPVLSLDPMEFSGYENEEVLRDNYDDLQEMEKVLFLYIACLFNDEDVDFVAPLIANIIDMDVSSGLKVLAERSLIHVSSNGEIVMHYLLRQMGREFLRLPGSSKKSERLVENSQSSMTTHSKNTGNWTDNLSDVPKKKRKADHVVPSDLWDSEKYSDDYPNKRISVVRGMSRQEWKRTLPRLKLDRNPKEAEIVQAEAKSRRDDNFLGEANNDTNSSSPYNDTNSFSSSLPPPPTFLSPIWKHHVYSSFHEPDVRGSFLSHIMESFKRKGIDPFIDSHITRNKSIGPELIEAIRRSHIVIVLLSRNYASSSWCLDELVEIMKCREVLIVMTIFYEVDPTDIKKQTGDFGKAFRKTCKGKKKEHTERWRKALEDVAKIAGEHSHNWSNEASMIEKIATDVSNMLNSSTLSRDFDGLVGMRSHMEKIRSLHWENFQHICLPSTFNPEFLVDLVMHNSKLQKIWEGTKQLKNLRSMNLCYSRDLKELPNLSTATNLEELRLEGCTSLVELPSSIENATNLQRLYLSNCSNLVELPSIGNATKLEELHLTNCSSLVKLPSSINATNLKTLFLENCSRVVELPAIENATNLSMLDLKNCSSLLELPSSIGTATNLKELEIIGCSSLMKLPDSIGDMAHLLEIDLSDCSSLVELPSSIIGITNLIVLRLNNCNNLVSLPQLSDSLFQIDADNCKSLERLDCSFNNSLICLTFTKCFHLNQEARDLIIHTSTSRYAILPGTQVPACFSHRATAAGSLKIKLNESPLPTSLRFKACIMLVNEETGDDLSEEEAGDDFSMDVLIYIREEQKDLKVRFTPNRHYITRLLTEHIYTFEVEAEDVTSTEVFVEFKTENNSKWKIGECGLLQILELPPW